MADVFVFGSDGYVGSVLVPMLLDTGRQTECFDRMLYHGNWLGPKDCAWETYVTDIRDMSPLHPEGRLGADALIHLAALSNDPLGALDEKLTYAVNYEATVRLAKMAKEAGVSRFIFVSSQSIYGASDSNEPLKENAEKNPLTAYSKSKWLAEQAIMELADDDFCVVALRPATVFGWSPMLRTDIVFNNMLAQAYTTGKIEVTGDGSEWRPVVHIRDLCNAFIACLEADPSIINGKAYNVGTRNYRVWEIAQEAKECWPAEVTFGERAADTRSYRTDGSALFNDLGVTTGTRLFIGGMEMVQKFAETNFTAEDMGRKTNRLAQLQWLIENDKLDSELRWK